MRRLVKKPAVALGAAVVLTAAVGGLWLNRANWQNTPGSQPEEITQPTWLKDPPSPDEAAGPAVRSYYERLIDANVGPGETTASTAEPTLTVKSTPQSATGPTTTSPDEESLPTPPPTTPPSTPSDFLLQAINSHNPKWVGVMTEGGSEAQIDSFAANAGRQPDLVQIAAGWEMDRFDQTLLDRVADRGAVLMLSWEPWDYRQLVEPQDQPKFALQNILDGAFDEYIDEWAYGLAGDGRPMLMRFAHEMNGNWYPWAEDVNGNAPGSYVATWYYIRGRFEAAGADNVLWVWSPNVAYQGSNPVSRFFPGEDAVDVPGLVGYFGHFNRTPERFPTFDELYGDTIRSIKELKNSPILITEASSTEVGGFKPAWTTDFLAQVAQRDDIAGFVWFDVLKESDWRIASSEAARAAFREGISAAAYN